MLKATENVVKPLGNSHFSPRVSGNPDPSGDRSFSSFPALGQGFGNEKPSRVVRI
jgi:hypothetical protein